jgi:CubicO group peptidase (beta-lactamase class C family)
VRAFDQRRNSSPFCTAVLIAVLAALHPAVARAQAGTHDAIERYLKTAADSGFSGVVLVAHGGRVILHAAYGATATARDTANAFWLASNTKQFTAAAILALSEDGKLRVGDRITRFIDDVPADKRSITLHQLLTHSAGFGDCEATAGIAQRARAVRALMACPLAYAPGQGYTYNSADYSLLAAIVEIVSKQPFESYVRTRLVQRAGMRQTGFWGDDDTSRLAHYDAPEVRGVWEHGRTIPNWRFRGGSGMYSTAADLYRWLRALQAGTVLTASDAALLWAPHQLVRHEATTAIYYGYGLGVEIAADGSRFVRHFGADFTQISSAEMILPAGDIIIVLSNAASDTRASWSARVSGRLRDLLER